MKKYIFTILIIRGLISCNTNPTDKLLSDTNNFINDSLLIKLKDPKSFEKIDLKINDTITKVEDLNDRLENNYSESKEGYLKLSIKTNIKLIELSRGDKVYKEWLKDAENRLNNFYKDKDSIKNLINKTPKDEIKRIEIILNYRAKNGFGALDFGKAIIYYYPNEKDFNKQFFIYNLDKK